MYQLNNIGTKLFKLKCTKVPSLKGNTTDKIITPCKMY